MENGHIAATRRSVLYSAAVGVGLGAWSARVSGRPGNGRSGGGGPDDGASSRGRTPLIDGPAEFRIFVARGGDGGDDPDEADEFGLPDRPAIAGEDPPGGIFDASDIEKTPNGTVLHHVFEFLQGVVIERDRGKPYVLRHEGGGRFTSRGQHVNFEARTAGELRARLAAAGLDPNLAAVDPLRTLAGGTWRGVGADTVQFEGDPADGRRLRWALTRVDFYRRGSGRPAHGLSALYAIYPNVDGNGDPAPANPRDPTIRRMPAETREAGRELVEAGRLNPGGQ